MADQAATFALNMEGNLAGAAAQAARALTDLKGKIDADTAALRSMQASLRALQGGSNVSKEAIAELKDKIAASKNTIAQATADYLKLGGTFERLPRPAEEAAASFDELARGTKKLGFGGADALMDIVGAIGTLPGLALTAASAIVALAGAVVTLSVRGLVSLASSALAASSEVRALSRELMLAAMAGGTSARSGGAFAAAVAEVSAGVPIARENVAKLAAELLKAGATSENLGAALRAAALGESVGVGGETLDAIKAAIKGGESIAAIADKLESKYGAIVEGQMLDWNVQTAKLRETFKSLLSGVKIEPLLSAVRGLFKMFEETTSTGRALKAIVETLLNPIFGAAPGASSALQAVFRGAVIGALKLAIAIFTVRNYLRGLASSIDLGGWTVDWNAVGQAAILAAVGIGAVAAVVGTLAALVFGSVAAVAALAFGFGVLAVKIVSSVGKGWAAFTGFASSLWNYVSNFVALGTAFVAGVASGIWSGLSDVITAAVGVAKGAVDAVKKTLKIASPSGVARELFQQFGKGGELGLEDGTKGIEAATAEMISIPTGRAGAPSVSSSSSGSAWYVKIEGVQNAEQLTDPAFQSKLAEAFERAAAVIAAPLEAGA